MGWYLSPTLKEPYTCEVPCSHKDCAQNRALVESPCRICGEPIGREARIYFEDAINGKAVHAGCLENEVA